MTLSRRVIFRCMDRAGVFVRDEHIVYAGGMHGDEWVAIDALHRYPTLFSELCQEIVERFSTHHAMAKRLYGHDVPAIEVVAGPATGGTRIATLVAGSFSKLYGTKVPGISAEKAGRLQIGVSYVTREPIYENAFVFADDDRNLIAGKRVFVVDDVLTTGGSVASVVEEARRAGASEVGGVAVFVNRGNCTSLDVGRVPLLISLLNLNCTAWSEKECPLCAKHIPVNPKLGHGKEFLARQASMAR